MVDAVRPFVAIVEDYDDSRDVFVECLRLVGFEAIGFACAEDALASFVGRPPDAVVTDLTLPGMSGEELARRLRMEPTLAAVPVFALSGRGLEGSGAELFSCTLRKPVNLDNLATHLRSVLLSSSSPEKTQ
jgi:DNA-binding response OmpR family regulator